MFQDSSLEALIENDDIGLEIFHPGGIETTKELCSLINIRKHKKILEIGSGTGETACFLAQNMGCEVIAIDHSDYLVDKARKKAKAQNVNVNFKIADAYNLPFENDSFDVIIAECVLTLLDKDKTLKEINRVLKNGGLLGIQDICWKETADDQIKVMLYELEHESTETIQGWKSLLEQSGFIDVKIIEKPNHMALWISEIKKRMGIFWQIKIFYKMFRKWGLTGIFKVMKSESLFRSNHISYVIIKTKKAFALEDQ